MTQAAHICPGCDEALTHRNLRICHSCWRALPKALTSAFNQSRTLEDQRSAMRAIFEHFRKEREQLKLNLP